jgi:hypothetical protein
VPCRAGDERDLKVAILGLSLPWSWFGALLELNLGSMSSCIRGVDIVEPSAVRRLSSVVCRLSSGVCRLLPPTTAMRCGSDADGIQ